MSIEIEKHSVESRTTYDKAKHFLSDIKGLQNDIHERIYIINRFGTSHHHINLPAAIDEANQLNKKINAIARNQINNIFYVNENNCADAAFNFWSNTSLIINHQTNETKQLYNDVVNKRNRLENLIEIAYRTIHQLSYTNDIHSKNIQQFDNFQKQNQQISQLLYSIHDLFNTNVIPQTDTIFNMIADGKDKLIQDIKTIERLKTVVNITNQRCAENIRAIRDNLLPEAKARSIDLIVRAEEYAKLFRNTKNSAEIAMLASTAYKNITDSIDSAQRLAIDTEQAARKSESELYPSNGESVIEKSSASLRKSEEIKENAVREIDKVAGNLLLQ